MKNKFRTFTQKLIIVITIIITFNSVVPTNIVVAGDGESILLNPILSACGTIIDALMSLMQMTMGTEEGWKDIMEDPEGKVVTQKPEKVTTVKIGEVKKKYKVPNISYEPQKIFENKVPALNANFLKEPNTEKWSEWQKTMSPVLQLRGIISKWYIALRDLAAIGLLSVLVYIGIRILLTSIASDKAKYKQMLMDWIVALCLLFAFHIIMAIVLQVNENLTGLISTAGDSQVAVEFTEEEGDGSSKYFITNLIGFARMNVELTQTSQKASYLLVYLILVFYTGIFTFIYLKRLLYMAFLTLMAPIVTLTYPIDKISDGKAQAFNTWLKEYTFNALQQPLHLLIYTVLVSSAITVAANNILYAIAAMAFIMPAEQLLRKMFGFDKASTANALGAFAGGAAATSMLQGAMKKFSGSHGGNGKSGGDNASGGNGGNSDDSSRVKTTDPGFDAMDDGSQEETSVQGPQPYNGQGLTEFPQDAQEETSVQGPQPYNGQGLTEFPQGAQERQIVPGSSESNSLRDRISSVSQWTKDKKNSATQKFNAGMDKYALTRGMRAKYHPIKRAKRMGKKAWHAAPGTIGKLAVGAAGAAAMGAVGLAAGVTTGKFGTAVSMAGAGLALGGKMGGNTGKNIGSKGQSAYSSLKDAYRIGKDGEGAAQQIRYTKKEENREAIAKGMAEDKNHPLTGEELDKQMERAAEYDLAGIKTHDEVIKAMKYEDSLINDSNYSPEKARAIAMKTAQYSQQYDNIEDVLSDPKESEKLRNKIEGNIKYKNRTEGKNVNVERATNATMENLKKYNKLA